MEIALNLAVFSAKALVITVLVLVVLFAIGTLVASLSQRRKHEREDLKIESFNEKIEDLQQQVLFHTETKKDFKKFQSEQKKRRKEDQKAKTKGDKSGRTRLFVLNFKGDIHASEVESLREEITAVLSSAAKTDQVLVRVESPGGSVTSYGLAASQLARIRKHGLHLSVCIDEVAASGGYLMAVVANKIYAAPFAVLGSIGVIAQVPNIHRLLKKHDVDFKEITSGEYKRTASVMGELTEKGLSKLQDQIEDTHQLFKKYVGEYRPQINIEQIATGETWYGQQAIALGLIDEIGVSDQVLMDLAATTDIYEIKRPEAKDLGSRLRNFLKAQVLSIYRAVVAGQ